ncbi:Thiol-disulfide oxidoreductase ResA [Gimesia panareensis]|uniref:Thiol-disulfide oxidoreductase ResA n=1 Tax=Gimesia panareensis TaxID=2527978 RepID=A0A518FR64_9PLAN|nr:TlpA disulfide reductase family protein [Gimesia panareensis]QDV18842.1 Thiol-disulfide oxidoreductase ResA [Gimesia panareensis]
MRIKYDCVITFTVFIALLTPDCVRGNDEVRSASKCSPEISVHPHYANDNPRYALLLFGDVDTQAAWMVVDGENIYLDRNCNGDLTEEGECIQVSVINKSPHDNIYKAGYHFVDHVDAEQADSAQKIRTGRKTLSNSSRYTDFAVDYFERNPNYPQDTPERKARLRDFLEKQDGMVYLKLRIAQSFSQRAEARFSLKPENAPVIKFDFPMTWGIRDEFTRLVRGTKSRLIVSAFTEGLRGQSRTYLKNSSLPAGFELRADVNFAPSSQENHEVRFDRTAADVMFVGEIKVPHDALGNLRLTIHSDTDIRVSAPEPPVLVPVLESTPDEKATRPYDGPGWKLLGKASPEITLKLLDGSEVTHQSLLGKKVVLSFWGSWCVPCIRELYELEKIQAESGGENVKFFAVNSGEDAKTVEKFLQKQKIAIPIALDEKRKVGQAFEVNGVPHTVLIGEKGTVENIFFNMPADRFSDELRLWLWKK